MAKKKHKKKIIMIIVGLFVLCCSISVVFLVIKNNESNLKNMTLRQAELSDSENNILALFDIAHPDIFEFKVDLDKINNLTLAVETLNNGTWTSVVKYSFDLKSNQNRILADVDFHKGGHFAIGYYDKDEDRYLTELREVNIPSELNGLDLDTDTDQIVFLPYGFDFDIVKEKTIILQLYYNGTYSLADNDISDKYENFKEFENNKNILAITATFTKK